MTGFPEMQKKKNNNIQIHTQTYVYLLIDAMFPVPKKAVIIKNTWRKSGVKNDTENIAHIVASGKKIYFGVGGGGEKIFVWHKDTKKYDLLMSSSFSCRIMEMSMFAEKSRVKSWKHTHAHTQSMRVSFVWLKKWNQQNLGHFSTSYRTYV